MKWIAGVKVETFSQWHKPRWWLCNVGRKARVLLKQRGVTAGGVAVKGKDRGQKKTVATDCYYH